MEDDSSWSRDLILANFQAASNIEDVDRCISILDSNNWEFQTALTCFFSEQDNTTTTIGYSIDRPSNTFHTESDVDVEYIPPPAVINLDPDISDGRRLTFNVIWHSATITLKLSENDTIGELKRLLALRTDVPLHEIVLEGWTQGDQSTKFNSTVLSSLKLAKETHLILHRPPKLTVSNAKFQPCNIDSSSTAPVLIDVENDYGSGPSTSSSIQQHKDITLNVHHNQRDYKLMQTRNKTVKDVKQELFVLTKIPTKSQEWAGWPEGTTDQSRLGDLELSQPDHYLILTSLPLVDFRVVDDSGAAVDSGTAASPEDTDDQDMEIELSDDDDLFEVDPRHNKKVVPLLPRNATDDSATLIRFQMNFEDRYRDFHPPFFLGPFADALNEAAAKEIKNRKPLLIYLHHDKSVSTNIFCSELLCSEQFTTFVSQNFVFWGWDVTFDSNKYRFINMLNQHFGNMQEVTRLKDSDYPLLLVVTKSKSTAEVCSVLKGNTSLDELMSSMWGAFEVASQSQKIQMQAEMERVARDEEKQEQDAAYHASLAADKAKADAAQALVDEEVKKQEKAEMEQQVLEAQRLSCVEQLPEEPEKGADTTNIAFRCPDGQRHVRRFRNEEPLTVLFMYASSKGFHTESHQVVSNFPRRVFTEADSSKTFEEMKLCPQASLFIEEL